MCAVCIFCVAAAYCFGLYSYLLKMNACSSAAVCVNVRMIKFIRRKTSVKIEGEREREKRIKYLDAIGPRYNFLYRKRSIFAVR